MKKILSNLLSGIASVLRIKQKQVEWKMSEDGKEYYDKKKENEFYDALEDGKTKKADAIRKDKQNKINKTNYPNISLITLRSFPHTIYHLETSKPASTISPIFLTNVAVDLAPNITATIFRSLRST